MINTVTLLGRLVADPELRHTQNSKAVTSFTLAVDSGWGDHKRTDFIDCVAWQNTAEFICKYFAKGRKIAVTGSLRTRSYEDKQGSKRKVIEIIAREVDFADTKEAGAQQSPAANSPPPARPAAFSEPAPAYSSGDNMDFEEILGDDDLPF